MSTHSQTDASKQHKKDIRLITDLFTRAKNRFSFKHIKSFRDVLLAVGYSLGEIEYIYEKEQLDKAISFKELKELEANVLLRKEMDYGSRFYEQKETIEHEFEGFSFTRSDRKMLQDAGKMGQQSSGCSTEIPPLPRETENTSEEIPILTSIHQKAKLFKFQNKAAWQILQKIDEGKRAILLRAGVGVGKTFILGAVLRQLLDRNLLETHQIVSPWPILWITRASIVEQTRRVCKDLFGIDTYTTCQVVNIEQLRAKLGDLMIRWDTTISGGEEHVTCTWKSRIHPFIFIIDECQLAKNEDSTQSKIIQAIADIPASEPVIIICSSATPFTRVIESRYFVQNTWKEIA